MTPRTARGSYTSNTAPAGETRDWRDRAACRSEDPELFFSDSARGPRYAADVAAATQVCRRCPVVTDCLQWALATRLEFGVAGGMGEDERRALTRPRHHVPDPVAAAAIRQVRLDQAPMAESIRSLASAGYNDTEIGEQVGWPAWRVGEFRRTAQPPIAAGRSSRVLRGAA
jgi:WhiB family redox-sensing transcriptional regulator